jgi:hypothetical protein
MAEYPPDDNDTISKYGSYVTGSGLPDPFSKPVMARSVTATARPRSAPVTYTNTVFPARPLGPGQRGDEIKDIQEELCNRRYKVAVDGYYGLETMDALETLGIPTVIDENTYNLILKGHDFSLPTYNLSILTYTGRKVRIMALGTEAGVPSHSFKIGEIVEELDASVIDPDRKTGIYILGGPDTGLSVPIPLKTRFIILDKDGSRPGIKLVDEFEFVDPDAEATLIAILSHLEKLDHLDDFDYMVGWIEKFASETPAHGEGIDYWAENICRRLGDVKKDHFDYVKEQMKRCVLKAEKK